MEDMNIEVIDVEELEGVSGGIQFRKDTRVYEVVDEDRRVLGQYRTLDEAISAARRNNSGRVK